MDDLIEDMLGPDVVVRRAAGTEVDIRPAEGGGQPLVGVVQGAVWARAEHGATGVDLGHGTLNVVVREGTVLLDVQAGSGLVIVLRGAVEISSGGETVAHGRAGDALTFDATGRVGDPDPVDATELARDQFVSLNLVLDALDGAQVTLTDTDDDPQDPPSDELDVFGDRKRGKGRFSRSKKERSFPPNG